jgi:tRNA A-37 threonylcarbamoyl transferase component Bud32
MVPPPAARGNDPLPHSEAIAHGDAIAHAVPAIAEALRELLQHDVGRWSEHGFLCIKQRTVRSVFTGHLGATAVHVKVYRPDSFADRARDLLRGRPGSREAWNLAALAALGLPTVTPLAHGLAVDQGRKRSFVVTATVAGAPFAWPATDANAAAAGALLRQLHDRGVAPGDLHPGNLLVADDGRLLLLDVANVQNGGTVDRRARARALSFFCQELDGGANDPRATALLRAYEQSGLALPERFATELDRAHRLHRSAMLPKFGKRAFRACRQTAVDERRRGSAQWHWHLVDDDDARRAACSAFAAAPSKPSKEGRRGAVWLLPELAVKQRSASAARDLWRASYWLQFADVPTPAPVALRLHRGRGLVFVRRLPGLNLAEALRTGALPGNDRPRVARQLGTAVGRLHAHGLRNRDLKLENLLLDATTGDVAMVDLDGVRRRDPSERRGAGRDLGRLQAACQAAGAADHRLLRAFWRGYLDAYRRLRQQHELRRLLRVANERAGQWASAHALPS